MCPPLTLMKLEFIRLRFMRDVELTCRTWRGECRQCGAHTVAPEAPPQTHQWSTEWSAPQPERRTVRAIVKIHKYSKTIIYLPISLSIHFPPSPYLLSPHPPHIHTHIVRLLPSSLPTPTTHTHTHHTPPPFFSPHTHHTYTHTHRTPPPFFSPHTHHTYTHTHRTSPPFISPHTHHTYTHTHLLSEISCKVMSNGGTDPPPPLSLPLLPLSLSSSRSLLPTLPHQYIPPQ